MMRTYVLAKNYQHYAYWCRISGISPNDPNFRYVQDPSTLFGVSGDEANFIFYETWREHPQASRLYAEVRMAKMKGSSRPVPPTLEQRMENDNFWYRLTKLDPAIYRGLIIAAVALLASVGVIISPGVPDALIGFIWAVSALVQAVWTRQAVTANAKVAVLVPDPVNNPQIVVAGEAITTAPNAAIISAATENPKP